MYYTGKHPLTNKKIYVPYSFNEKKMQKALLHFQDPEQHEKIYQALKLCRRLDLIGSSPNSLIPSTNTKKAKKLKSE